MPSLSCSCYIAKPVSATTQLPLINTKQLLGHSCGKHIFDAKLISYGSYHVINNITVLSFLRFYLNWWLVCLNWWINTGLDVSWVCAEYMENHYVLQHSNVYGEYFGEVRLYPTAVWPFQLWNSTTFNSIRPLWMINEDTGSKFVSGHMVNQAI